MCSPGKPCIRGWELSRSALIGGTLRTTQIVLVALVLASCGLFVLGAVSAPQRMWANLLMASFCLLSLGLGAAVLLALLFVTGARWSDSIRPLAERLVRLLPAGALGMGLVLIIRPSLFPWSAEAAEPGSAFQNLWLTRPFFLARACLYVALWLGLAWPVTRYSQLQDRKNATKYSALFLVVFAITYWLASVDWIMSLEPTWTSTVFGIYHFSGMFLSALAAVIVLSICYHRGGAPGRQLKSEQMHDLGTLLFSFSSFWMYIWFSQYLLIWFVNNPEEAEYFVLRQQPGWQPLFFANLVLNWAIPFVVLLFRPAKEHAGILLIVALIVLIGRLVDLYLMVLPAVLGGGAAPEGWDICLLPGLVGLAVLILVKGPAPSEQLMEVGRA
jgi:hypothetical protein